MFDINEIEINTIKLDNVINTFNILLQQLDNNLNEDYYNLSYEHKNVYNDLCSYNLMFSLLLKSIKSISEKYYNQVDNFYSNKT